VSVINFEESHMDENESPEKSKPRLTRRILFVAFGLGSLYVASSGPILGLSERSKVPTFFERFFDFRSRQKTLQAFYSPLAVTMTTFRMERIVDHYFTWFGATEATTEITGKTVDQVRESCP